MYVQLTDTQLAFWRAWRSFPERPINHRSMKVAWKTDLDPALFKAVFKDLVHAHDALRLRFTELDGVPYQYAADACAWDMPVRDFSDGADPLEEALEWLTGLELEPFDLTTCAFTTALAKVGDGHWIWSLNQHHVITDYTSSMLLVGRLAELYALRRKGMDETPDYPSFLEFLTDHMPDPKQIQMTGSRPPRLHPAAMQEATRLPHPKQIILREIHLGKERLIALRTSLGLGPDDDGPRYVAGLFETIVATTFAFMHRVSGEDHIALGSVSHGRFQRGSDMIAGPLIRNLPLSLDIQDEWTCRDLLAAVKTTRQTAFRKIRRGEKVVGDHVGATVNFIPETLPDFEGVKSRELIRERRIEALSQDLNITVRAADSEGDVRILFQVNEDIARAVPVDVLASVYLRIFDTLVKTPDCRVSDIALGGPEDRKKAIARAAVATNAPLPPYLSLVEGFLQQVSRRPDAIAVQDGATSMTYAQLELQSRHIASALVARGIQAGELVAIQLPRSAILIATILGILRTSAAYFALDTRQPMEKTLKLFQQTAARLVVSSETDGADTRYGGAELVDPDTLLAEGQNAASDLPDIDPDGTMYVMFTSGSTNEPKGIEVSHRSFAIYDHWAGNLLSSGQPLNWALATTLSFESAFRSFMALTTGGTIVTYDAPDALTGMSLIDAIRDDRVDGIAVTPSQLRLLSDRIWTIENLRSIISIGEVLTTELAHRAVRAFGPAVSLQNWYGPTEATMASTAHVFDAKADSDLAVPIGGVGNGVSIYILDQAGNVLPDGLVGEIYIGGIKLSKGYLNRPDLTAKKFIADPFRDGGLMYGTGDLGRYNAQGVLVHHGRTDDQIKINGVRTELAEVEAGVSYHPAVIKCAVVAINQPDTRLAAFYVADTDIPAAELRRSAERILARGIVPGLFQRVDEIPLLHNGKTDRRTLAARAADFGEVTSDSSRQMEPPESPVEATLARIWRRVLDLDKVWRHDDFFEIGGDSLSFVQMILLLEAEFACHIPLVTIGDLARLQDLAQVVSSTIEPESKPAEKPKPQPIKRVLRKMGKLAQRSRPTKTADRKTVEDETVLARADTPWEEVRRRMMLTSNAWPGEQVGAHLPVMHFNRDGARPPLFWCFNGAHEPAVMARELGLNQPLYGLRSMQAVVQRSDKQGFNAELARSYVDEITRLQPDGPYYLGGNCQSARISELIAAELLRRGAEIAQLLMLDYQPMSKLDLNVGLFYGRESQQFNPFLSEARPELKWQKQFAAVTWDIVPGGHGQYFSSRFAPCFCARVADRLEDARNRVCPMSKKAG
ncbi:amino acid adenylation domain-containing protein [Aliiroseovarius sp. S1123]|uniref:non-ribosomal peptide synthetase n=1 Tax=unclassified Aliiroseovarius TaxID=2623558 RepID=UPI001FF38860|nr:amino acid adenylation domain-containing protein [Aliiroseovarius sp. S1123]MCK0172443.1 amino acid adenylation domain-containing protein [Aliiroseovarius sp. S1123]